MKGEIRNHKCKRKEKENFEGFSLLHTSDVSAIATQRKSSVKREKCNRKCKRKKKENFVFLVLVLRLRLRLCQNSSSVKRENVSAIVNARYEPPCLRRLCSNVKVLVLAIALVLTSLV